MNDRAYRNPKNQISREAIINALFETYESIYDIDTVSGAYQCYHESDYYSNLNIENSGDDFFANVKDNINKVIYFEDREHVCNMLNKDALLRALSNNRFFSFVYRLMVDGKPLYHKIRATTEVIEGRKHILLGVRNVDDAVRTENWHQEVIAAMHKKEKNYLDAILASAWGYIEANLTKDTILERSQSIRKVGALHKDKKSAKERNRYNNAKKWFARTLITDGMPDYKRVSDRNYLIKRYNLGEKRASVSFSAKTVSGAVQPFKEVFYMYNDGQSSDILVFCVIYDLTEQQRREKEFADLQYQLQMSRIHNFTSQMQPHFLYNALGSIQEIILENPKYASKLIGDFTIHLRSCIRAMSNDSPIPFNEELGNIKSYVNIEKMRFGDKLNVEYRIGIRDFSIIPLSIQPLVENAIRHGIYNRGNAGGTVIISTEQNENSIIIKVIDNGMGFDYKALQKDIKSGKRDSTGLKNLMFRFEKVMNATVDIKSVLRKGTAVTVIIPKG